MKLGQLLLRWIVGFFSISIPRLPIWASGLIHLFNYAFTECLPCARHPIFIFSDLSFPYLSPYLSYISVHNSIFCLTIFINMTCFFPIFLSTCCISLNISHTHAHTHPCTQANVHAHANVCLFTNSFIQQIFSEHLPCNRHPLSPYFSFSSPICLHSFDSCLVVYLFIYSYAVFSPIY